MVSGSSTVGHEKPRHTRGPFWKVPTMRMIAFGGSMLGTPFAGNAQIDFGHCACLINISEGHQGVGSNSKGSYRVQSF